MDYIKEAIKEAKKASKINEVPVGAVIVCNNSIIAKAHNTRMKNSSLLNHAEVNCIIKACKVLNDWRLDKCDMYVTLEPCNMCKAIISESRITNVYYLMKKNSNTKKNIKYFKIDYQSREYEGIFNEFFKNLRNKTNV